MCRASNSSLKDAACSIIERCGFTENSEILYRHANTLLDNEYCRNFNNYTINIKKISIIINNNIDQEAISIFKFTLNQICNLKKIAIKGKLTTTFFRFSCDPDAVFIRLLANIMCNNPESKPCKLMICMKIGHENDKLSIYSVVPKDNILGIHLSFARLHFPF